LRAESGIYESNTKEKRPVDRPNCGSGYYDDKYGDYHFAADEIVEGFSVAAGWACMKKCWKGYKIATGHNDWEQRVQYARKIVFLCRMLKITEPAFSELEYDE
jgi:hypothetical protein